jgi:hypothetical protein
VILYQIPASAILGLPVDWTEFGPVIWIEPFELQAKESGPVDWIEPFEKNWSES